MDKRNEEGAHPQPRPQEQAEAERGEDQEGHDPRERHLLRFVRGGRQPPHRRDFVRQVCREVEGQAGRLARQEGTAGHDEGHEAQRGEEDPPQGRAQAREDFRRARRGHGLDPRRGAQAHDPRGGEEAAGHPPGVQEQAGLHAEGRHREGEDRWRRGARQVAEEGEHHGRRAGQAHPADPAQGSDGEGRRGGGGRPHHQGPRRRREERP
mmetsp:Transcript_12735/g.23280  ORF Transcript_12735/g.23280 Transcript_12735/m.23280 type:complete len:209 (+) Transcript_12735:2090-2716(+)